MNIYLQLKESEAELLLKGLYYLSSNSKETYNKRIFNKIIKKINKTNNNFDFDDLNVSNKCKEFMVIYGKKTGRNLYHSISSTLNNTYNKNKNISKQEFFEIYLDKKKDFDFILSYSNEIYELVSYIYNKLITKWNNTWKTNNYLLY